MANLHCHMAEINATLWSNYPPTKKKKKVLCSINHACCLFPGLLTLSGYKYSEKRKLPKCPLAFLSSFSFYSCTASSFVCSWFLCSHCPVNTYFTCYYLFPSTLYSFRCFTTFPLSVLLVHWTVPLSFFSSISPPPNSRGMTRKTGHGELPAAPWLRSWHQEVWVHTSVICWKPN